MWIDLVFAVIAAFGFYWGYSRGIIRTVVSVAALFIGFVLAVRFAPQTTEVIAKLFKTPAEGALPLIGFVVTFVLVLLILRLVANAIEKVLTTLKLNFLNKVAGGLATSILATLIFSILLIFVNSANLISEEAKDTSMTYSSLEAFPDQAYAVLGKAKPALEDVRDAGKRAMEGKKIRE
ncbi:MAG: CvpA family protein [Saprospiraceae bacterium]